MVIAVNAC